MSELVGEKDVVVRWEKKDRYGRILGDVHLGPPLNLEMVKKGWHGLQAVFKAVQVEGTGRG